MRFLAHYTIFNGTILHLNVVDFQDNKVDYFKVKEETAHTLFIEGILLICNELDSTQLKAINSELKTAGNKPVKEVAEAVNALLFKLDKNDKQLCAYQIKDISLERYYISKLV